MEELSGNCNCPVPFIHGSVNLEKAKGRDVATGDALVHKECDLTCMEHMPPLVEHM